MTGATVTTSSTGRPLWEGLCFSLWIAGGRLGTPRLSTRLVHGIHRGTRRFTLLREDDIHG
jgi:hypothetical protein